MLTRTKKGLTRFVRLSPAADLDASGEVVDVKNAIFTLFLGATIDIPVVFEMENAISFVAPARESYNFR